MCGGEKESGGGAGRGAMDGEKSGERGGDAKEEGESLGKVTSLLHYLSLSVFGNCISHILKEYF